MGELVTYRQNDFGPSDSVDLRQMSNAFRVILWIVGVGIQPLQLCLAFQAFTFASHSRINPTRHMLSSTIPNMYQSEVQAKYCIMFCFVCEIEGVSLFSPGNKKESPKWSAIPWKVNRSIFHLWSQHRDHQRITKWILHANPTLPDFCRFFKSFYVFWGRTYVIK